MPENVATPASDPITAAIENSIADLPRDSDTGGADEPSLPEESVAGDTPVVEAPEGGSDSAGGDGTPAVDGQPDKADAAGKPEAKKEESKDEVEKELEALGLGKRELAPGERENRLPYSRVQKIVGNAIKRANERVKTQVSEATSKVTALEAEITPYRRVDELIAKDPEKYLGLLATLHPTLYGKYVGKGVAAPSTDQPAASTVPAAADDPEPKPDHKFEDGTLGYTPEQHAKLLKWNHRQGVREAETRLKKEMDERLGPIEAERRQREEDAAAAPRVSAQKGWATKTFGKLFTDDYAKGNKSEILALMRANDGQMGRPYLSFEACVAQVLVPKQAADRNIIRASVMDELSQRPAAAVKTPAAAIKAPADEGPRTMEQVIKDSLVAAGLSGK